MSYLTPPDAPKTKTLSTLYNSRSKIATSNATLLCPFWSPWSPLSTRIFVIKAPSAKCHRQQSDIARTQAAMDQTTLQTSRRLYWLIFNGIGKLLLVHLCKIVSCVTTKPRAADCPSTELGKRGAFVYVAACAAALPSEATLCHVCRIPLFSSSARFRSAMLRRCVSAVVRAAPLPRRPSDSHACCPVS